MTISSFARLIEVPRRTYTRRRARWLAGEPTKGPWPAPTVDRIEPTVAKLAAEFPAWGHRKIWALHHLDHPDEAVSQSSVRRAMARRDLLQPVDYQRERRELAKARRAAFVEPPTHRNQVWQLDFSEFETTATASGRSPGAPTTSPSTSSPAGSRPPRCATTPSSRYAWPSTTSPSSSATPWSRT